jgi:hypothetical protein
MLRNVLQASTSFSFDAVHAGMAYSDRKFLTSSLLLRRVGSRSMCAELDGILPDWANTDKRKEIIEIALVSF